MEDLDIFAFLLERSGEQVRCLITVHHKELSRRTLAPQLIHGLVTEEELIEILEDPMEAAYRR